jgi:hypothetical protein
MDSRLFSIKNHTHHLAALAGKQSKSKKTIVAKETVAINMTSYATILLREYNGLVSMLAQADEKTLQLYNTEINHTIDKLINWFDKTTTTATFDVYWDMRRLRSKLRNQIEKQHGPARYREQVEKYA